MSWEDSLRDASFRGVQFFVSSHDYSTGRRAQTHEFPDKDESFSRDLGRKKRDLSFSAYIVGNDYHLQRNALIDACEKAGAADLVHPFLGTFRVICTGLTISEGVQEGGLCRISLSFVEEGQNKFPANSLNPKTGVTGSIEKVEGGIGAFFDKHFSTKNRPSFVLGSSASKLTGVLDSVNKAYKKIPLTKELAVELPLSMKKLQTSTTTAVGTPAALTTDLKKGFSFFKSLTPKEVLKYSKGLLGIGKVDSTSRFITANRTQESKNLQSLGVASRVLAVTSYASALIQVEHASFEDALIARQFAIDAIDNELDLLSTSPLINDDDLFDLLQELSSKIVAAVPAEQSQLPHVTTITLRRSSSAVVLSYKLYGELSMEEDILSRNKIINPAFVPADTPIEVLTSVR